MLTVGRMRIGAAWRRRTGSLVVFVLLVAVSGGVVLTAVAGARRTHSAPARFLVADGTPDAIVAFQGLDSLRGVQDVIRQPEVATSATAVQMMSLPYTPGNLLFLPQLAPTDDRFGTSMWRGVVVAGRRPEPAAADEVMLSESQARRLGAHVGDLIPTIAFTRRQTQECFGDEQATPACRRLVAAPNASMRVVGIARTAIDVNSRPQDISFSMLSRGYFEQHRSDVAWTPVVMVALRPGASITEFADHTRTFLQQRGIQAEFQLTNGSATIDAINVLSTGLLLFALVAAVAAAFAIGQVVARQVVAGAADGATLTGLGVTRAGRRIDAAGPVAVAAALGAILAIAAAYIASYWMPIGSARRIDPNHGFDFDATVLLAGAGLLVGFVVVVAVATASVLGRRTQKTRPSLSSRLAGVPVRPSVGIGLSNAFGGNRDSVPARAAFGGIAAATAGVVAVLVFGAGLQHLLRTPRLYGWGWDAMDIPDTPKNEAALLADPDVADLARLERRAQVSVAGHPTFLLAVTPVRGSIQPTIVQGRAPVANDEVALGRDSLQGVHKAPGDDVEVRGNVGSIRMRIVGVAAFATADDGDPLAEGAVVTPAGKRTLAGVFNADNESAGQSNYVVRFRPDVDRAAALARLESVAPTGDSGQPAFSAATPPAEVERLRQVDALPRLLALFLAAIGLIAISHALFVGVRRRARDYAVLRAIGFRPRDVRTTVSSEAFVFALGGAAVGIPLGILIGRYVWRSVAEGLGVVVSQPIPLTAVFAALPVALAVALVAALIPGRRAARLRPGEILRTE